MKIYNNINWAWGIAVVYSFFVLILVGFVIFSTLNQVDLVSDDYYAQEIKYQQQIDRINRARTLDHTVTWRLENNEQKIYLTFPALKKDRIISGKIILFRPSDATKDRVYPLHPNRNGVQVIDVRSLSKGFWRLKIFWNINKLEFYEEGIVVI
jgi:hypothetical protein